MPLTEPHEFIVVSRTTTSRYFSSIISFTFFPFKHIELFSDYFNHVITLVLRLLRFWIGPQSLSAFSANQKQNQNLIANFSCKQVSCDGILLTLLIGFFFKVKANKNYFGLWLVKMFSYSLCDWWCNYFVVVFWQSSENCSIQPITATRHILQTVILGSHVPL